MTFTNLEIKEIRDGLRLLEKSDVIAAQAVQKIEIDKVKAWWNTIKPAVPQTRDEALEVYRWIEETITTETNPDRLSLLRQKLQLANEKFKERKRNG